MIIEYRGRKLEVKDKFVEDYNRFNLTPFNPIDIDIFVFNVYMYGKKKESEIPSVVATLSDEEILAAIEADEICGY